MKGFIILLICGVVVAVCSADVCATDHCGNVWGVWSPNDNPHNITCEVSIPPESTLIIQPGCYIDFQGHYKFIVDTSATLIAVGTPTDSIIFTVSDTSTGWHGIRFLSANNSSQLSYCRIEYGKAVGSDEDRNGGAVYCNNSNPILSNNIISNNSATYGGGIYCDQSSPAISNNTISNNSSGNYGSGGGISCRQSSPTISGNTITSNSTGVRGGGIWCYYNSNPNITSNTISNNSASSEGGGISCLSYSNPTISGNTISNNSASGYGGGISCYRSSPTISNNTIINNSAYSSGGGIWCGYYSHPAISSNTISNNSAIFGGGGLSCYDHSSPTISNSTISNNSAGSEGGGIFCYSSSSPAIINNTISNNSGSPGGGIHCYFNSNPNIRGNAISGNSAGGYYGGSGGGIYCSSSNPATTNNIISNNSASGNGGGIYCSNFSPTISNNTIINNSASGNGGGIYSTVSNPTIFNNTVGYNSADSSGGGIWCSGYTDTIRFNVITNNTGPNGGGIYLTGSNCVVLNNSISNNSASSYGGGLYCTSSSPTVKNNILYFDSAPNGAEIWLASGSNPSVTYCDIQGVWPGSTNIHADPLYVDYWHEFYDLQWGSPCINVGDPALNDPDGTRSDMGALYHYLGITDISMMPVNPPINVPAGGYFNFNGILQNLTAQSQTTTVWIKLNVPGYGIYGPIMQFNNIPIAAYDTLFAMNVRQDIPSFAPLGTYTYIAYCGTYPSSIIDSCYFGFDVTAPIGGSANDWNVSKWFEGNEGIMENAPSSYALGDNYPNPFNAQTNIIMDIPKAGEARLEVYNLLGQKVATLIDGNIEAGHHTISWDANEYSSGIYFYKLTVGEQVFTKRMTLLK